MGIEYRHRATPEQAGIVGKLGQELMDYAEQHGYSQEAFDNTVLMLAGFVLASFPKRAKKIAIKQISQVSKVEP